MGRQTILTTIAVSNLTCIFEYHLLPVSLATRAKHRRKGSLTVLLASSGRRRLFILLPFIEAPSPTMRIAERVNALPQIKVDVPGGRPKQDKASKHVIQAIHAIYKMVPGDKRRWDRGFH